VRDWAHTLVHIGMTGGETERLVSVSYAPRPKKQLSMEHII